MPTFLIPAGPNQIEAQLRLPRGPLRGAVLLCHPHPVYGGTMDNRVIYRAAHAASEVGYAALRFNFRGVGQSSGQFDQGIGEKEDVSLLIGYLAGRFAGLPIALAGYSFGAWVGLEVGCLDPRVGSLVGLGLPLSLYDFGFLERNPKPSLYIIGTRDEYCSAEGLDRLQALLPVSSRVSRIEGSDHFFGGHVPELESLVAGFLRGAE